MSEASLAELLAELNRAKVAFQLRAIQTATGLTAQGIEARQGRDGNRLDPKDESPVGNADAPKGASHD